MIFFCFLRKFISINNLKENSHEYLFNYRNNHYFYSPGADHLNCCDERQEDTGIIVNEQQRKHAESGSKIRVRSFGLTFFCAVRSCRRGH